MEIKILWDKRYSESDEPDEYGRWASQDLTSKGAKMVNYKIYNTDCIEIMQSLKNESIDLILTDPPFGQGVNYGRAQLGHRTIKNDDNLDWLPVWAVNAYRLLKNDKHCIVFWQWRTYSILEKVMLDIGFEIKTVERV